MQLRARNGSLGARTVLIDGTSDQLLARAALAGDEHRDILCRDTADGLVDLAHGRAGAHDDAVHVRVGCGLGDDSGFAHPPGHLYGLADDAPQLVQIERLEQVVVCSLLHRFDGDIGCLGHGNEDNRDARVDVADAFVDLQTGLVGQGGMVEESMTSAQRGSEPSLGGLGAQCRPR